MRYISLLWKEARIFDRWSLVHFLSGATVAFVGDISWLTFKQAVVIGIVLFVAWEVFEIYHGIYETISNRISDIIVAVLGMAFLFTLIYTDENTALVVGTITSILLPVLSFFGWRAYLIRTKGKPPRNVHEAYQDIKEDISL